MTDVAYNLNKIVLLKTGEHFGNNNGVVTKTESGYWIDTKDGTRYATAKECAEILSR